MSSRRQSIATKAAERSEERGRIVADAASESTPPTIAATDLGYIQAQGVSVSPWHSLLSSFGFPASASASAWRAPRFIRQVMGGQLGVSALPTMPTGHELASWLDAPSVDLGVEGLAHALEIPASAVEQWVGSTVVPFVGGFVTESLQTDLPLRRLFSALRMAAGAPVVAAPPPPPPAPDVPVVILLGEHWPAAKEAMASLHNRPVFHLVDHLADIANSAVAPLPVLAAWPTGHLEKLVAAREALHIGQSRVADLLSCPSVAGWERGEGSPHGGGMRLGVSAVWQLYAAFVLEAEAMAAEGVDPA